MSKKAKKRKRLDRRGRPAQADARSRQTTRAGRQGDQDEGTPELRAHRERRLGGELRGADAEFPPDVLVARGLIDRDMRDEFLKFAMLSWWLYGAPVGCEKLYERMVAGGGGDDFAPRAEGESDDPEEHKRRLALIIGKKRRHEKMLRTLGAHAPYIRRLAVHLTVPGFVAGQRSALAFLEMSHIVRGGALLVASRDQEDKARRAAERRKLVSQISTTAADPGRPPPVRHPPVGLEVATAGGGIAFPAARVAAAAEP